MSATDKNAGSNKEERIDERVGDGPKDKVEADEALASPGLKNEPTVGDDIIEKGEKKADKKAKAAARKKDKHLDDEVSDDRIAKAEYRKALYEGTPPDYPWAGRSQAWREEVQAEIIADSEGENA